MSDRVLRSSTRKQRQYYYNQDVKSSNTDDLLLVEDLIPPVPTDQHLSKSLSDVSDMKMVKKLIRDEIRTRKQMQHTLIDNMKASGHDMLKKHPQVLLKKPVEEFIQIIKQQVLNSDLNANERKILLSVLNQTQPDAHQKESLDQDLLHSALNLTHGTHKRSTDKPLFHSDDLLQSCQFIFLDSSSGEQQSNQARGQEILNMAPFRILSLKEQKDNLICVDVEELKDATNKQLNTFIQQHQLDLTAGQLKQLVTERYQAYHQVKSELQQSKHSSKQLLAVTHHLGQGDTPSLSEHTELSWYAYLKSKLPSLSIGALLKELWQNFQNLPGLIFILSTMRQVYCQCLILILVRRGASDVLLLFNGWLTRRFAIRIYSAIRHYSVPIVSRLLSWCKLFSRLFGQIPIIGQLGLVTYRAIEYIEPLLIETKGGQAFIKIMSTVALGLTFPSIAPYLALSTLPALIGNIYTVVQSITLNSGNPLFFFDRFDMNRADTYVYLLLHAQEILCPILGDKTLSRRVCDVSFKALTMIFGASFIYSLMISMFIDYHLFIELYSGQEFHFDPSHSMLSERNSCVFTLLNPHKASNNNITMNKREELLQVLGLSGNASESEIKKTFKQYSLQHHPDKTAAKDVNLEQWYKVSNAYTELMQMIRPRNQTS